MITLFLFSAKSPRVLREETPLPVIVRVIARPKPIVIRTLY